MAMTQSLRKAAPFVAGVAILLIVLALPGHIRSAVSLICSLVVFEEIYRWHRREIRAGRREPIWFGKRRQRTP